MPKYFLALIILAGLPVYAQSTSTSKHGPDCSGSWPTNMAQATLKDAGILKNEEIDFAKSKTVRLASEQTAKDLWHQVYLVKFHKKSGDDVKAIVIHDASAEECSMTDVQVFVVSTTLNVMELPD